MEHLDLIEKLEKQRRRHKTYFYELNQLYRFSIQERSRVLELGCHTGRLLAAVNPKTGIGIDIDADAISLAQSIHKDRSELQFLCADVETFDYSNLEPFDYVILSDLTPLLKDVQNVLVRVRSACKPETRIILNFHNNLWYPLLQLASAFGWRTQYDSINWLSQQDVRNLLYLSGMEEVTSGTRILLPFKIPFLSAFFNRVMAILPGIRHLSLVCFITARCKPEFIEPQKIAPSVSIIVPTLNECGNVENIFNRTPKMGSGTELIFVDGRSTDGTIEAIQSGMEQRKSEWDRLALELQTGKGKGQAVRQGFSAAQGDILMILDSDLTMAPEDLPKYFQAIVSGQGEFINGSRLVYPMERHAMRFLNMIANKLFAILFTWLLGQPVKDTLCGTKVLWRRDYDKIAANRKYFGDFDPFGDFDLLFGASKLNLKIIDIPIRYRDRVYGEIKIERWKHGWLLLKMCMVALRKLKLPIS